MLLKASKPHICSINVPMMLVFWSLWTFFVKGFWRFLQNQSRGGSFNWILLFLWLKITKSFEVESFLDWFLILWLPFLLFWAWMNVFYCLIGSQLRLCVFIFKMVSETWSLAGSASRSFFAFTSFSYARGGLLAQIVELTCEGTLQGWTGSSVGSSVGEVFVNRYNLVPMRRECQTISYPDLRYERMQGCNSRAVFLPNSSTVFV